MQSKVCLLLFSFRPQCIIFCGHKQGIQSLTVFLHYWMLELRVVSIPITVGYGLSWSVTSDFYKGFQHSFVFKRLSKSIQIEVIRTAALLQHRYHGLRRRLDRVTRILNIPYTNIVSALTGSFNVFFS